MRILILQSLLAITIGFTFCSRPADAQQSVRTSYNDGAYKALQEGRYAEATQLFKKAIQEAESVKADDRLYAISLIGLSRSNYKLGQYGESEGLITRAKELFEKNEGFETLNIALILGDLAKICKSQARYLEAEAHFRKALAIQLYNRGPEHPDVAMTYGNLAALYESQGKYMEAEANYRQSLWINERLLGPEHLEVATTLGNLAGLCQVQGRLVEAEQLIERAIRIKEQKLGLDHPEVAIAICVRAGLYQARGDYLNAQLLYLNALKIQRQTQKANNLDVATTHHNLGVFFTALGNYPEADEHFKLAREIKTLKLGDRHPSYALTLSGIRVLKLKHKDYNGAFKLQQKVIAIQSATLPEDHPELARSQRSLATLLEITNNGLPTPDSLELEQRSMTVLRGRPRSGDTSEALRRTIQGNEAFTKGDFVSAEAAYLSALGIYELALGPDAGQVAQLWDNLSRAVKNLDRKSEANVYLRRSREIRAALTQK